MKADQLKKAIWRDIDNENGLIGLLRTAAKIVSGETVEFVARQLAALHRPKATDTAEPSPAVAPPILAPGQTRRIEPTFSTAASQSRIAVPGPECKECASRGGSILYGKYGYYFKCDACGKNTAIRFTCQPGHQPRLRKDRDRFYRECGGCDSSELFHRNVSGGSES